MPGRRRLLLAAVALLSIGACTSTPSTDSGGSDAAASTTAAPQRAGPPASFALALGIDPDDGDAVRDLAAYDTVVLDGEGTSEATIAELQDGGTTVLAYLSAGTVEPGRPWFADAEDGGWLLDHWDDWDEWYADVAEPGMRDLVVDAAESELAKGFDGLFLDNTDMVQAHPDQREGMIELVAALDDLVGPDRQVWAQNGDPVEAGIVDHLDGWNREDVSWTYDFNRETYAPVSEEDHDAAIAMLTALADRGLVVTATDYTDGTDVDAARTAACDAGALSFVSDIGLSRIADPPVACPTS